MGREGFVTGWRNASASSNAIDTIGRQTTYVRDLRARLSNDTDLFRTIYRYTFNLIKPENQKSAPMEAATDFWKMFFSSAAEKKGTLPWNSRDTKWLDLWIDFYQAKVGRPVNKDLWNMVLELVLKIKETGGENLEWWNENAAWPMAIDEFVVHVKEQRKALESMDVSY